MEHVTMISIVIGVLGTAPKGLEVGLEELEIRRWIMTIQTIAFLWSAKIQKRVLKTQTAVKAISYGHGKISKK